MREQELKREIETALESKRAAEAQIQELETDLASLRAQNSLFSEWMLVRNENALIAKTERAKSPLSLHSVRQSHHHDERVGDAQSYNHAPHLAGGRLGSQTSHERRGTAPAHCTTSESAKGLYIHTTRVPQSPTKTRSMTTASPVKQVRPLELTRAIWLSKDSLKSSVCATRVAIVAHSIARD